MKHNNDFQLCFLGEGYVSFCLQLGERNCGPPCSASGSEISRYLKFFPGRSRGCKCRWWSPGIFACTSICHSILECSQATAWQKWFLKNRHPYSICLPCSLQQLKDWRPQWVIKHTVGLTPTSVLFSMLAAWEKPQMAARITRCFMML